MEQDSKAADQNRYELPHTLNLLCVSLTEPDWKQLILNLHSAGCLEPRFRWASSSEVALAEVRESSIDCLLLEPVGDVIGSPDPHDSLAVIRAMRSMGHNDPVVVIADTMDDALLSALLSHQCEHLVSLLKWESPVLPQVIHTALTQSEMETELQQLSIQNRRRLQNDQNQATYLLAQQQAIIQGMAAHLADISHSSDQRKPEQIGSSYEFFSVLYSDLLRTYVVMDPGSLSFQIRQLAEEMAIHEFSLQDSLKIHHEQTQILANDMSGKSQLHIISRANTLGMELLAHLGDYYLRKSFGS